MRLKDKLNKYTRENEFRFIIDKLIKKAKQGDYQLIINSEELDPGEILFLENEGLSVEYYDSEEQIKVSW